MKKRFCLLIALLLSLCLSCAAEPILESTPFLLEAEELLELVDQYQQVPSVALGEEATLNLLKDAELILGAEPTDAQTILDTGAVITLADRAALNVHGALRGWIADIVLGEESEINVFLSDGALMDALLPEELVEPEKLEALKAAFTYYGLNISDLDDPDSIYVFDASGNRIHFGNGDKTDSIVYPGEHYTVLVRSGVHTGRQLSFELDPSVPLSLAELLAQNPITAKLSLEATDVAEGADVPFTATLSRAARRKAVVALRVGEADYTIDIPAGASSGSVLVANPNGEDPYLDAGTLTATVTGFTGGGFDRVYYRDVSATANISDTIDTTKVSLSATDGKEGDSYVTFTVSLSNPAQTAATATVQANGKSHTVTIPAGKSSATLSVPNPNAEDVYLDASALTATVTAFSGGNFEKVDYSGATATANISDTIDTTRVSLSATDGKEGDSYVTFTVSLSNPAQTAATATVKANGKSHTVTIPAGKSSGTVSVPNPNAEDVYLDACTLTASVTGFIGGDFEKVDYSGATATANIADTIDTTTVSLSAPSVIARYADNVVFTITLSNPAQTSFSANFTVDGQTSEIVVPAGKSSFTCSVPNPCKVFPNMDAFSAKISFHPNCNFESVDYSGASTTVRICDPVVVSLSANDVSEYAPITFNVTLSAPATTAATVTVNVGGTDYTVDIAAGATSGSVDVPNPYSDDPYLGENTLTGTVTGVSGGGFDLVDYSGATATAKISDTVDTTKVSLSASNYGPTDTHATFTVTLSNPAQTAADVTVNVGGTDYTVYIAASATSGSVSVLVNGAPLLTGTVTGLTGANFEAVDYSTATATARTHYTATVSISGHDIGMSDGDIHFTIYLSKAPKTDATATVKVGDANQTVTISAGNTSASLYVRNPHLGELSFVTYTLSAEVTSISGGGFTSVDCSGAKTTVSITPVPAGWHCCDAAALRRAEAAFQLNQPDPCCGSDAGELLPALPQRCTPAA